MLQLDVTIEFPSELKKILDKNIYSKVIQDTLLETAVEAEGIARREAPIKTGYLRRSITHFAYPTKSGLSTKAKYWRMVEYGTKAHVIKPKNPKGFLAWKENGEWHSAKQVQHPGTEANPFLKRSLNKVRSQKIPAIAFSRSLKKYTG